MEETAPGITPASDGTVTRAECASVKPIVHVLTYCAHPVSAYGNLLVFDSIRTGFPGAHIEVWDNGSCAEVLPAIRAAAERVGASFNSMPNRHYAEHLRWVLLERPHPPGVPLVLCDPDVVFWENVEAWDFGDALMAGRLIPQAQRFGAIGVSRLHSSLLFIPDVSRLREAEWRVRSESLGWDAVAPRTSWFCGVRHFWDLLAELFHAVAAQCTAFEAEHLDSYDHLFCGTHLGLVGGWADAATRELFMEVHQHAAMGNVAPLRGVWRRQQRLFETPQDARQPQPRFTDNALATLRKLSECQGAQFSEPELVDSLDRMIRSLRLG